MSVFISYRRDCGKPVAEAIYHNLHKDYNVFLDTESLKNGYFDSAITTEIEECTDFIIIITETVFDRCNNPNDWILREGAIALCEHKNIIPIFAGTQNFPPNIPEALDNISRFNGIIWRDEEEALNKIKAFLLSNHRYSLWVVKDDNHIALADKSKADLIELYLKFIRNGRHSVDIDIELYDIKELSELLIEKEIVKEYGIAFAKRVAEQSLLGRIQYRKEILTIAIEYLLMDEMIDANAIKMRNHFINKYGKNLWFVDEDGVERPLWIAFAWFDIIEELLKDLIMDRYFYYGNSNEYIPIDCSIEARSGRVIWSFISFVKKQENDGAYKAFAKKIYTPGSRAIYIDIPPHSLIQHVYPDMF